MEIVDCINNYFPQFLSMPNKKIVNAKYKSVTSCILKPVMKVFPTLSKKSVDQLLQSIHMEGSPRLIIHYFQRQCFFVPKVPKYTYMVKIEVSNYQ